MLQRLMRYKAFELAADPVEIPYHGQPAQELNEVHEVRPSRSRSAQRSAGSR